MENGIEPFEGVLFQARRLLLHPDADWLGASIAAMILAVAEKELIRRGEPATRANEVVRSLDLSDVSHERFDAHFQKRVKDGSTEGHVALAYDAACGVPFAHFCLPPLSHLGRILRNSEFEIAGSTLRHMWISLLSRICDVRTQMHFHPSYAWLLSQLDEREAIVLSVAREYQQTYDKIVEAEGRSTLMERINRIVTDRIPNCNNDIIMGCIDHIEMLGLIYFFDHQPGDDQEIFYILPLSYMDGHISFNGYGLRFLELTLDR